MVQNHSIPVFMSNDPPLLLLSPLFLPFRAVLGNEITLKDILHFLYIESYSFDQVKEYLFESFKKVSSFSEIEEELSVHIDQASTVSQAHFHSFTNDSGIFSSDFFYLKPVIFSFNRAKFKNTLDGSENSAKKLGTVATWSRS